MNWVTRIFLVLLRIAIGWHLFFEGVTKIESVYRGEVYRDGRMQKPWSSAGYLRESVGPLSEYFRSIPGADPDDTALALLTPQPLPPGKAPADVPAGERLPPALRAEWDGYYQRFVQHYGLNEQEQAKARKAFELAKTQTGAWLLAGVKEVEISFPDRIVTIKKTTPERVEAYRRKVAALREVLAKELPAFEQDVRKRRLALAKEEVNLMRAELLSDLDKQTAAMQTALAGVLTAEQKAKGPVPPAPATGLIWGRTRLEWADWITRWGLTVSGLCLMLGLFTRLACVAGAALLALFYISYPALPWVPEPPRSEGFYIFINKNIIELVALLALATTRSGRWVGLDGLLALLNPFRGRSAELPAEPRPVLAPRPAATSQRS
jgi:uncharacterized membrane protein YphA (DoxX/SURF4 family)